MSYKYNILIKHNDGSVSYLSHKGRDTWGIKTAYKHLRECVKEQQQDSAKWEGVRYFACVMA